MDFWVIILFVSFALAALSAVVLVVVVLVLGLLRFRGVRDDKNNVVDEDFHEEPIEASLLPAAGDATFLTESHERYTPEWLQEPLRAGNWRPEPAPAPEPEPEPAPAPVEYVPVASVEMWFGEARVGVKQGSRTYDLLVGYAQAMIDDFKQANSRN